MKVKALVGDGGQEALVIEDADGAGEEVWILN